MTTSILATALRVDLDPATVTYRGHAVTTDTLDTMMSCHKLAMGYEEGRKFLSQIAGAQELIVCLDHI